MTTTKTATDIIRELLGAIDGLETQVGQMRGMFDDDDDPTIQEAVDDSEAACLAANAWLEAQGAPATLESCSEETRLLHAFLSTDPLFKAYAHRVDWPAIGRALTA
jgi:hypothetical protein